MYTTNLHTAVGTQTPTLRCECAPTLNSTLSPKWSNNLNAFGC